MFKILVTFRISSSIHTKKEKRNCLVEYIKEEVSSAPKLYINNGKVKCIKQSLSFKQRGLAIDEARTKNGNQAITINGVNLHRVSGESDTKLVLLPCT